MMQWLCALPKFESKKKCYCIYQKRRQWKELKNDESRIEGSLPNEISKKYSNLYEVIGH